MDAVDRPLLVGVGDLHCDLPAVSADRNGCRLAGHAIDGNRGIGAQRQGIDLQSVRNRRHLIFRHRRRKGERELRPVSGYGHGSKGRHSDDLQRIALVLLKRTVCLPCLQRKGCAMHTVLRNQCGENRLLALPCAPCCPRRIGQVHAAGGGIHARARLDIGVEIACSIIRHIIDITLARHGVPLLAAVYAQIHIRNPGAGGQAGRQRLVFRHRDAAAHMVDTAVGEVELIASGDQCNLRHLLCLTGIAEAPRKHGIDGLPCLAALRNRKPQCHRIAQ